MGDFIVNLGKIVADLVRDIIAAIAKALILNAILKGLGTALFPIPGVGGGGGGGTITPVTGGGGGFAAPVLAGVGGNTTIINLNVDAIDATSFRDAIRFGELRAEEIRAAELGRI